MRAADLPGRLPQAPSGRRSAALQLLLVDCTARVNSVPPKESALAFKTCERMPPPKLPLATIAEHDPIYPYQTLLVLGSFLAMTVPQAAIYREAKTIGENPKISTSEAQPRIQKLAYHVANQKIRVHFQYRIVCLIER